MTKIKICKWLDSNQWGGVQLNNGDLVSACCASFNLDLFNGKKIDFSTLTREELQNARKDLFNRIQINNQKDCINCPYLIEKDEENIDIGKLSFLSIANFKTCNLRCKYCYYTKEELSSKLTSDQTKIMPIVKNFYKNDLLKEDSFCIAVAGGESTLVEDLVDVVKFISTHFSNSIFNLQSNSTLTHRIDKFIGEVKDIKNVYKFLYTSIDAGTPETYKMIRGQDLFYTVIHNLYNYAKNNVFDEIDLKYLFVEGIDELGNKYSNINNKDIFGFLQIIKLISDTSKKKVTITIDKDLFLRTEETSEEIIKLSGKIYYVGSKLFNLTVNFVGGGIAPNTTQGTETIKKIKEFALNYPKMEKTYEEEYFLNILLTRKIINSNIPTSNNKKHNLFKSLFQTIFSIKNNLKHKVITICGIKINFKKT